MTPKDYQLHTTTPEGQVQILQVASLNQGRASAVANPKILLVSSQPGFQYKLIEGEAGSHQNKGWEQFTDKIISLVNEKKENVVFLLWGNFAQKKGLKIDRSKHLVLESGHPSPMSANQGKWFENKHFSQTNDYLEIKEKTSIDW